MARIAAGIPSFTCPTCLERCLQCLAAQTIVPPVAIVEQGALVSVVTKAAEATGATIHRPG
ncbi:MAG: hypothetical protein ACREEC_12605, partial [Thermoplasmata archaeon]